MGAFQGSISYARFHIQGELPDNFADRFVRRIRNKAFEPLSVDDDGDRKWGWCSATDPFDLELDREKVLFNSYLNLGLRVDRWAVPSALFKAHFAQAQKALLEKRGRDRLTRREKDELRTIVTRKLRKQILPTMRVTDLSWNLDHGIVRFWSRSGRAIEVMQELFEKTFELKLVPHGAYAVAVRAKLGSEAMRGLESLEPAAFHAETE